MSKKEKESRKVPLSIFFLFALLVAVAIGYNNYLINDASNPQVQANKDNIAFLLNQSLNRIESDITLAEAIGRQAFDTAELRNATEAKFDLFQAEIVKNKQEITMRHPVGGNEPTQESGDSGQTEFPSFKIEATKDVFTKGEPATFTGNGLPGKPVCIFMASEDNSKSARACSLVLEDGTFVVDVTTEFDFPIGKWRVTVDHDDQKVFLEIMFE